MTSPPPSDRARARWVNLHELVKLDTTAAFRCKHCDQEFSAELVEHHVDTIECCDPQPHPERIARKQEL